jgi:hypothetical protein
MVTLALLFDMEEWRRAPEGKRSKVSTAQGENGPHGVNFTWFSSKLNAHGIRLIMSCRAE